MGISLSKGGNVSLSKTDPTFPIPVGMNRYLRTFNGFFFGVPHTCGDEPPWDKDTLAD